MTTVTHVHAAEQAPNVQRLSAESTLRAQPVPSHSWTASSCDAWRRLGFPCS